MKDAPVVVEALTLTPHGSILGGSGVLDEGTHIPAVVQNPNSRRARKGYSGWQGFFTGQRLSEGGGKVANEKYLVSFLEARGFGQVWTDLLSVWEQWALLSSGDKLVACDGLIVHLFDHVAQSRVAVLLMPSGDANGLCHKRSLVRRVSRLKHVESDEASGDVNINVRDGDCMQVRAECRPGFLELQIDAWLALNEPVVLETMRCG